MEQTYDYTVLVAIACDSCRNLAAGDTVDIALNQALIPALPASIRGIVQLVDDLTYTIQYDTDDLLGAAVELDDTIVTGVTCVPCCVLAEERAKAHSDAADVTQDDRLSAIEGYFAALGVIPSAGDNQFLVHPDSTEGVSIPVERHDKDTAAKDGGTATVILDPEQLATPLGIADLTGAAYRIDVEVSVISFEKPTDNRDSAAEYALVGEFDAGASVQTKNLLQKDGVSLIAAKVGNTLHITCNNPSSGDVRLFVTSKFRILS